MLFVFFHVGRLCGLAAHRQPECLEPKGNQVTISSRQATVVVTVLAPDLIRVRMVPGISQAPDHSYAVVKTDWPQVPIEVTGDKGMRIMRTPELEVRAQLSPFRLAFYDRNGKLISKDADSQGMSWEGPRVRCWKSMREVVFIRGRTRSI